MSDGPPWMIRLKSAIMFDRNDTFAFQSSRFTIQGFYSCECLLSKSMIHQLNEYETRSSCKHSHLINEKSSIVDQIYRHSHAFQNEEDSNACSFPLLSVIILT